MKNILKLAAVLMMSFCLSTVPVNAAEVGNTTLTPEQQAVISSYENTIVTNVDTVKNAPKSAKSISTAATTSLYRGSLYRGSALMWSKDYLDWNSTGTKVTNSSAYQEAGYIFPNIARATGITKYSSSSSSVTYRGSKTIGAGVVTPWGDVTVYENDINDFLCGYASGNFTTY